MKDEIDRELMRMMLKDFENEKVLEVLMDIVSRGSGKHD